jgi:hypothetical protein
MSLQIKNPITGNITMLRGFIINPVIASTTAPVK